MKILVTGSSGLVGKKLVEDLRKRGHYVREFTRSKGQNILNKKQLEEALKEISVVYHLAAELDENSTTLFETNVEGARNIVEACGKQKISQLIYMSTCSIYGNAEEELDEKSAPNPLTRYGKSKLEAEKIVSEYLEVIPITIIRAPLVLANTHYWKEIFGMLGKGFPIIGSGKNEFQMAFLEDLVSALVFVLGKDETMGETFIVCQEDRMVFREICEEIMKDAGFEKKLWSIPNWLGMAIAYFSLAASKITGKKTIVAPSYVKRLGKSRKYNISKIKAIGWKPKYSTKEAIALTVKEILAEKETLSKTIN